MSSDEPYDNEMKPRITKKDLQVLAESLASNAAEIEQQYMLKDEDIDTGARCVFCNGSVMKRLRVRHPFPPKFGPCEKGTVVIDGYHCDYCKLEYHQPPDIKDGC